MLSLKKKLKFYILCTVIFYFKMVEDQWFLNMLPGPKRRTLDNPYIVYLFTCFV